MVNREKEAHRVNRGGDPQEKQGVLDLFHPQIQAWFRGKYSAPRDVQPWKLVRVERINGEAADVSPYTESLIDFGFRRDYKALVLRA